MLKDDIERIIIDAGYLYRDIGDERIKRNDAASRLVEAENYIDEAIDALDGARAIIEELNL